MAPHPVMRQFYTSEQERRARLTQGFDHIAAQYDSINRLMSFGSDGWYRRGVLRRSGLKAGMSLLDVGCGTGMTAGFAKEIVGPSGRVVGVDPSKEMLAEAVRHGRVHSAVIGRAEQLPVTDAQFDMVTMTFALRHVADLPAAFKEFKRVLRPGGEVLILEMTTPQSKWRYWLLKLHMKYIVPGLASLRPGGRTARWLYKYCWESHDQCVRPYDIILAMEQAGLKEVDYSIQIGLFSEFRARKI
jgi:demethylmenaquinone methyltransferase/2-methoxy-6-polyprenyl-1,4-benzoquinol methylase